MPAQAPEGRPLKMMEVTASKSDSLALHPMLGHTHASTKDLLSPLGL